ncbi:MAG: alpha/beta hydrolase-fold protein, partial [Acidobacteriota bacterium]|nr:alpha/beta hydrolase-fold protein [Acidobacteriota bacterium]
KEFIPTIESQYRIRTEKAYRGISGLSMGGHGALVYSLRHPEMFAACAAFSAAIFTDEEVVANPNQNWARTFGPVYGANLKGQERVNDHLKSYSAIHIVKNAKPDAFKSVRLYLDCGDDDFLYKGNSTFHILLRDLKIEHEYRVRNGGHAWTYWRTGLADGLKFIGDSFHR